MCSTKRRHSAIFQPMVSTGQEQAPDPGVLADQQLLARAGFYSGTPNGFADEAHIAAVRRAREALGLQESNAFDDILRARLRRAAPAPPVATPPPTPPPTQTQMPPVGTSSPAPIGTPPATQMPGQVFPIPPIGTAPPMAASAPSVNVAGVIGAGVIGVVLGFTWGALLLNRRRGSR